jgi:putative transposase
MIRAFKYRMYPRSKQLVAMEHQFGLFRWLHNFALEHRITSFKDQANELAQFKELCPDFKTLHSQIIQDVLKRLVKSFQ